MASPKAPAISGNDLISKLTTVMQKGGVYGKDSKKGEPYSEKGDASKDSPFDSSDKGGHKLDWDR